MQETLTRRDRTYSSFYLSKKNNKSWPFIVLIIVLIVILSVWLTGGNSSVEPDKFYFLSLDNTTNKNLLEQMQLETDEVVGASYIYKISKVYHVIGFIYESNTEANNNLKQVKNYLPKAQIITMKNPKIKRVVNNKIKNDFKLKAVFSENREVKNKVLNLCKNVKVNEADISVFRELTRLELNLSENLKYLSNQKENGIINAIKVSNAVKLSLVQGVKTDIAKSSSVLENLKILYIKVVLEELNLKNTLNKL